MIDGYKIIKNKREFNKFYKEFKKEIAKEEGIILRKFNKGKVEYPIILLITSEYSVDYDKWYYTFECIDYGTMIKAIGEKYE